MRQKNRPGNTEPAQPVVSESATASSNDTAPAAAPSAPALQPAPAPAARVCDQATLERYSSDVYNPAVQAETARNATEVVLYPEASQITEEEVAQRRAALEQHFANLEALGAQYNAYRKSIAC